MLLSRLPVSKSSKGGRLPNRSNKENSMCMRSLRWRTTLRLVLSIWWFLTGLVAGNNSVGRALNAQESLDPSGYFDIGDFQYPVSTNSAEAQTWFDRGLAMCQAFNHEEAVRCFELALSFDPGMPMAFWGLAYAWGPNINNMQIESSQLAQAAFAIRLAKLHARRASDLENSLVDALEKRYALPVPSDRSPLNQAYAEAMRQVYKEFQDDPLVVALLAEALMDLRPWAQWSADGKPADETTEILAVIEEGLRRWPKHPMLCHLYIHAMEASPTPEKALEAANRLRNAMPGAGHMVHMPSHIDVLVGDYASVIDANRKAIEADAKFVEQHGSHNFYAVYRIHNYHFLVYGAMFDGQSQLALKTSRELVNQVPVELLKTQTDMFDAFIPTTFHVLVRFGRWEEILNEPEPASYLPMTRSIWCYARALAYAATSRIPQAEIEEQKFMEARTAVPESSMLFNNHSLKLLDIAQAMLRGEIAYRRGEFDTAFEFLREAVRLDDALNYDEPWGWMQPARHALGALLLEQNLFDEAVAVYRVDLKKHPRNPWALHGLAESLAKQGNHEEAMEARRQLALATQRSDINIDRSCFCRLPSGQTK